MLQFRHIGVALAAGSTAALAHGWPSGPAQAPLAAGAHAAVSHACRHGYGPITQSMDGRFSSCLRIGPLRPGPHTVVLLQLPQLPTSSAPPRKLQGKGPKPFRPPHEPSVTLSLSPSSGGPGTVVTITGRVAGHLPRRQLAPDFCWNGCRLGLAYAGLPIHRTSAHTFRARIVVPAAPWVEGAPVRVAPLASGTYPIAVQCVVSGKGCSGARPEGSAPFHLHVRAPLSWCPSQGACARLEVSPAAGTPGQLVAVSGFAPLVSVTGADQPFVFQLEVLPGRPRRPAVDFSERRWIVEVTFGAGALEVRAPPSFAGLRHTVPLVLTSAGPGPISASPLDSSTVGWCAAGSVELASGGASTAIPTAAAASELAKLGYQTAGGATQCTALALLDNTSGALTGVAGAFPAAPAVGGPPFYNVPLVTYDRGQSWTPLTPPPGAGLDGFGGFRYQGAAVEAVFAKTERGGSKYFPALDQTEPEALIDSGGGWRVGPIGCPPVGPCLTLGPYLPGPCAMIQVTQPLLRSTDGGVRWRPVALPDPVQSCATAELLATSPRDALLVNSMSPYLLVRSADGGARWRDIGIPLAPGERRAAGLGPGPGGITALPDGDLLLTGGQGYAGGWELLRHGRHAWCPVRSPGRAVQRAPQLSSMIAIGGDLFWLAGSLASDASARLDQAPLASLSC